MGNRAIIKGRGKSLGIYLHWNGGRDSVEGFLKYCELKEYRTDEYGWARLCQVIGNFFGGGLSVGIGIYTDNDDHGDNGTYIIKDWKIIDRLHFKYKEQREYKLKDMLKAIDEKQPIEEQLGEVIEAEEKLYNEIEIGDVVYLQDSTGKYGAHEVVGIGKSGEKSNGQDLEGVPYISKYYCGNINNYLRLKNKRYLVKPNKH